MRFTVELTIWVDEDHPEVNLTAGNPAQDVLDLFEQYVYDDDYVRLEDINVKEDR